MRKTILLMALLFSILPLKAKSFYYTYEGNTCEYEIIDEEAKTVSLSYNYLNSSSELILPEHPIDDNNVEYTLIEIGYGAFANVTDITSVNIPNSVTSIGEGAFHQCSELISVTFSDSLISIGKSAFRSCAKLDNLNLPDSLISIEEYAFYGCGLTSITIGQSLKYIGNHGLYDCPFLKDLYYNAEDLDTSANSFTVFSYLFPESIENITIGEKVKTIPDYFAFNTGIKSITITNSVKSIGELAFCLCDRLSYVDIGSSVTEIKRSAFESCEKLDSIHISSSVSTIGRYAFNNCPVIKYVEIDDICSWVSISFKDCTANPLYYAKNLYTKDGIVSSLAIPEGVTKINDYAFYKCISLISLTLPSTLVEIGSDAFSGCSELQRIEFPTEETFYNIQYVNEGSTFSFSCQPDYYIGTELFDTENVIIPEYVTNVSDYLFYKWKNLKKVDLHDKVEHIGYASFNNCVNLSEVNLSSSLKSIGSYAFYSCVSLSEVNLSSFIKSIGSYAFYNCYKISSLKMPKYLESIGSSAFVNCTGIRSIEINNVNDWARLKFGTYSTPFNSSTYSKLYVGENRDPVTNLVIEGEKKISNYAFEFARFLKRVWIKDGAPIGNSVFIACTNLTDVYINSSNLASYCFEGCENIKNVYVPLETPPTAEDDSFSNYDNVTLYVPIGCVSKYENSQKCWWKFSDIKECDFEGLETLFAPDYVNGESSDPSSVEYITDTLNTSVCPNDIYTLQGVCLKRNAQQEDIEALAPGLYIIAGKKVLIK